MTPQLIISTVCAVACVSESDLIGERRVRRIAFARQVAMTLIREYCVVGGKPEYSYGDIGQMFGKRDHGTAMHARDYINGLAPNSMERKLVQMVKDRLGITRNHDITQLVGKDVLIDKDGGPTKVRVANLTPNGEYVCLRNGEQEFFASINRYPVLDVL